jgi:hypothetical protein
MDAASTTNQTKIRIFVKFSLISLFVLKIRFFDAFLDSGAILDFRNEVSKAYNTLIRTQ